MVTLPAALSLRRKLLTLRRHLVIGMTSTLMRTRGLSRSTVLYLKALQFSRCGTLMIEIGVQATNSMSASCLLVGTAQPASYADGSGCDQYKTDEHENSNSDNRFGHGIKLLVDLLAGWM